MGWSTVEYFAQLWLGSLYLEYNRNMKFHWSSGVSWKQTLAKVLSTLFFGLCDLMGGEMRSIIVILPTCIASHRRNDHFSSLIFVNPEQMSSVLERRSSWCFCTYYILSGKETHHPLPHWYSERRDCFVEVAMFFCVYPFQWQCYVPSRQVVAALFLAGLQLKNIDQIKKFYNTTNLQH